MEAATEHLRGIARVVVDTTRELVPLRAALLVGSAGRGDADLYSDLDLILYVDSLPPDETLAGLREGVGGTNAVHRGRVEHFCGEEVELHGVRTEVSFATVASVESRLALDWLDELDTPIQTAVVGLLEELPLHGEDVIETWRARVREYPEALRRATIERHWRFFPLWYHAPALTRRDAELWRVEVLVDAALNLLAVLAGLNRMYFTRHELKRMRALVAGMERALADLADRLESLLRLEPPEELARLVGETRALVAAEYPDFDLGLRFDVDARRRPWTLAPSGADA